MDADDSEAARLEAQAGVKRESIREMLERDANTLSRVMEEMTRGLFRSHVITPPK
jgi:hypothetical protein